MKARTKETVTAYLFLLPNFLGFLIFTSLPVIFSLLLSFFQWDFLNPPRFIGLSNFVKLLGFSFKNGYLFPNDPHFWYYVFNTLFLMLVIPLEIFGALIVALALNQKIKGIVFYRTIFYLPTICSGVAIAIMWRGILNPDFGLLNTLLEKVSSFFHLDLQGPNWLSHPFWARISMMLVGLWTIIGGNNCLLFLAALQSIPRDLYEAAEIDGANCWQKFWKITWPMISPTTFFIAIMSIIGGFQGGFMLAYIMTGGGPGGATTTIEYYIFNNLYTFQKAGYAASIAWVLFIIIFFFTRISWKYGGKLVEYH
ncbi:MAG: sugar ABC transporter permease [Candidatus Omnitrophica bacterium]|nr:sugar ABC transporter permease [Candidatus Omnitrophota bacterium]